MKISERGINFIQHFEGFYSKPYYCPAGVLTIGFGTVIKKGRYVDGITKEQATELMMNELNKNERSINRLIKVELNQNQFDALCSFVYNLGAGSLQVSTLRKKLNSGEYLDAANEFLKWVYGGGKKLKGLVIRRRAERELFMNNSSN